MIPENALEEMTKNMDPNLVIVEAKNGVQMKWDDILVTKTAECLFWILTPCFWKCLLRLSQFPALELDKFLEDVR